MGWNILWLALAGAAGTLCRYGVVLLSRAVLSERYPIGTFVVNALGCFLFGLVWSLGNTDRARISADTRLIILAGFMGAFTTLSSFAFDTQELMHAGRWGAAGVYLVGTNVAGLGLLFAGLACGRAAV